MSDFVALFPRRLEAGRACESSPVVGRFTARAGSEDACRVGALCCRVRMVMGKFGRAWAPARSRVAGEIMIFLPNHTLEATAPRADSLVRRGFHHIIVAVGAALPGAVPQLSRSP
jgi:hypothetical protein